MFFCSAIFFALQIVFCTSFGVDGDVFDHPINVTVLPKLNSTYPIVTQHMENNGTFGGDHLEEGFIGFNTTGKPDTTTAHGDGCLFMFSCAMFYTGVGTILVVLALAIFIVGICIYAKNKGPYILPTQR